jgi:hypothetical protein
MGSNEASMQRTPHHPSLGDAGRREQTPGTKARVAFIVDDFDLMQM